jgi:hypothetical protein
MPTPFANDGPIVDPHGRSCLMMNSCIGTSAIFAISLRIAEFTESVMYLWLQFILIVIP